MNLGGLDWPAVRQRAARSRPDMVSGQSPPGEDRRPDMVSGQDGRRPDMVVRSMCCTYNRAKITFTVVAADRYSSRVRDREQQQQHTERKAKRHEERVEGLIGAIAARARRLGLEYDEAEERELLEAGEIRRPGTDERPRVKPVAPPSASTVPAVPPPARSAPRSPACPPREFGKGSSRFSALDGALSTRANFRAFAEWFYAWENEELREQKRRRDFDYRLKELEVVRRAIASMVPGASEPHVEHRPRRLVVSLELDSGEPETLALNQLSGGHRIVLAVAGDLARRMAHGNPHLEDPLSSEAIVLIDEVELHLHPEWQQRVLPDLTRTFPNTQFIVTTHSPQVLTAVRPEQIVELARDDDRVVAGSAPAPTYGAEAGDVLFTVMRVDERPPGNEFTKVLNRYMRLIEDGKGESGQANALRRKLERLSPQDRIGDAHPR